MPSAKLASVFIKHSFP